MPKIAMESRAGIILTDMTPIPKKSISQIKQYLLTQTGRPDFANKELDQQVALLSELINKNPQMRIYRIWSKLDSLAHSVIMMELGLFNGKVRAQHYDWAREDAEELRRHTRKLETFLKKQVEHENIRDRRPRWYMPRRYFVEPEGGGTLRKVLEIELLNLKWSVNQINQMLKKRSRWDVRGIIRAQEYVKQRAIFWGLPKSVRLTPAAIADIYELSQYPSYRGNDIDTAESIRKAIAYYAQNRDNAYFIQNISFYLEDWKKPASKPISGN